MRAKLWTRRDWIQMITGAGGLALLSGCGSKAGDHKIGDAEGSRVHYGTDQFQFGDLQLPTKSGPHPVAIVIHGGFWRSQYGLDHIAPMCPALNDAGWATWNIEYRRVGNPGGGWPGTFLDVASAADYLRELATKHNLDLNRVVSLGHSAGGHLAIWLAARPKIRAESELYSADPIPLHAAVSLAGVVDLRQGHDQSLGQGAVKALVGGTPDTDPDRYSAGSPADLLPLRVHQVLIHGTDDRIVPVSMGRAYCAAATAKGDKAELIELDATGHFELVSPGAEQGKKVVETVSGLL